jgi:hypothetical protein
MKSANGIFLAIVICAVLAVAVFFLVDLSADKVYASPEEVFNASRAAIQKKDLRAWCRCLTDDSRDIIAAKPVLFFFKEVYEKAQTKEEKAILTAIMEVQTKHGLTQEHLAKLEPEAMAMDGKAGPEDQLRFAQKVLQPVNDRNAFFADLYGVILKESDAGNPFGMFADGKLIDVKTEGKVAMGTIAVGGREGPIPMMFRKQGEGWRIDIIASQKQEGPPRPRPGFKHP